MNVIWFKKCLLYVQSKMISFAWRRRRRSFKAHTTTAKSHSPSARLLNWLSPTKRKKTGTLFLCLPHKSSWHHEGRSVKKCGKNGRKIKTNSILPRLQSLQVLLFTISWSSHGGQIPYFCCQFFSFPGEHVSCLRSLLVWIRIFNTLEIEIDFFVRDRCSMKHCYDSTFPFAQWSDFIHYFRVS